MDFSKISKINKSLGTLLDNSLNIVINNSSLPSKLKKSSGFKFFLPKNRID